MRKLFLSAVVVLIESGSPLQVRLCHVNAESSTLQLQLCHYHWHHGLRKPESDRSVSEHYHAHPSVPGPAIFFSFEPRPLPMFRSPSRSWCQAGPMSSMPCTSRGVQARPCTPCSTVHCSSRPSCSSWYVPGTDSILSYNRQLQVAMMSCAVGIVAACNRDCSSKCKASTPPRQCTAS